jgi:hypothetical protein
MIPPTGNLVTCARRADNGRFLIYWLLDPVCLVVCSYLLRAAIPLQVTLDISDAAISDIALYQRAELPPCMADPYESTLLYPDYTLSDENRILFDPISRVL